MAREIKTLYLLGALSFILLVMSSCPITPSINMGVGFDDYDGGFHARPHANVGLTGRP